MLKYIRWCIEKRNSPEYKFRKFSNNLYYDMLMQRITTKEVIKEIERYEYK